MSFVAVSQRSPGHPMARGVYEKQLSSRNQDLDDILNAYKTKSCDEHRLLTLEHIDHDQLLGNWDVLRQVQRLLHRMHHQAGIDAGMQKQSEALIKKCELIRNKHIKPYVQKVLTILAEAIGKLTKSKSAKKIEHDETEKDQYHAWHVVSCQLSGIEASIKRNPILSGKFEGKIAQLSQALNLFGLHMSQNHYTDQHINVNIEDSVKNMVGVLNDARKKHLKMEQELKAITSEIGKLEILNQKYTVVSVSIDFAIAAML